LTRPTARRRARALFDVCAGFVYSQILYACVRLKLFDLLAVSPYSAANIASALKLPLDATERLLEAAVSLHLVEKRQGGRFGLGSLGAALQGNPAVGAMVEHHKLLYADLRDPVGLLRGEQGPTKLARYWNYGSGAAQSPTAGDRRPDVTNGCTTTGDAATDERNGAGVAAKPAAQCADLPEAHAAEAKPAAKCADYTELMANSQPLVAGEILDAYPLSKHRCLLDVGGGDGSFVVEASKHSPQIKLMLFDLPAVAQRAALRFERLGLSGRAQAIGGNFLSDNLPVGADVVSLVRVIHDHDDGPAAAILRAVYRALPDKGVLLLAEPMMGTPGAETVGDAYFGFYLLAMGRGKPRTPQGLRNLLRTAGFSSTQLLHTHQPLQSRVIVARKN
jgi:demethylspheroidene O-methyltransferase